MIINGAVRDLKVKGRKFKNEGRSVGIIERNDGERIPISLKRSDVEKHLSRHGDHSNITLNIDGEEINTIVVSVQRDVVFHFPHSIEFKEL